MLREPHATPGLPAGLPDVLFDLGLGLAQIVHGAVGHLAPIGEADLQRYRARKCATADPAMPGCASRGNVTDSQLWLLFAQFCMWDPKDRHHIDPRGVGRVPVPVAGARRPLSTEPAGKRRRPALPGMGSINFVRQARGAAEAEINKTAYPIWPRQPAICKILHARAAKTLNGKLRSSCPGFASRATDGLDASS